MAKPKKSKKEKTKKIVKKIGAVAVAGSARSKRTAEQSRQTNKTVAKKPKAKKQPAKKVAKKQVAKKTSFKIPAKHKGLPEEMLSAALKVLDEKQADQIVTVPLAGRSAIADYMIIASGRAGRQVAAIADHLREAFFKLGVRSVRIEGQQDANWVLVDAGDVIIHLFLPEVRRYYDLDALWSKRAPKK